MNELENRLRKQKRLNGEPQERSKEESKKKIDVVPSINMNEMRKNLEGLYGGTKQEPSKPKPPADIPKGNKDDFMNAKKLLQQQLGGKAPSNSGNAVSNNLPPPPPSLPSGGLPLPPPPPPPPSLPSGSLPLPPPPPLTSLPLPPPPPPPPLGIGLPTAPKSQTPTTNTNNKLKNLPSQTQQNKIQSSAQNAGYYKNQDDMSKVRGQPILPSPSSLSPPPSLPQPLTSPLIPNPQQQPEGRQVKQEQGKQGHQQMQHKQGATQHTQPSQQQLHRQRQMYRQQEMLKQQQRQQENYRKQQQQHSQQPQQQSPQQQTAQQLQRQNVPQQHPVQQSQQPHQSSRSQQKLVGSNENISSFTNVSKQTTSTTPSEVRRKKIFRAQSNNQHQLVRVILGRDVGGYFKNSLFYHTDVINNIALKTKKAPFQPLFPSFQQGLRNQPKKVLYFHPESDVVSQFLTYMEGPRNRSLADSHNTCLASFKKRAGIQEDHHGNIVKIAYDWKSDPCKLLPLRNAIAIAPSDTDFMMLDYARIKRTLQKIAMVLVKYHKQKKYQKCLDYQNASDALSGWCRGFWALSQQEKVRVKQKIASIIQDVARL